MFIGHHQFYLQRDNRPARGLFYSIRAGEKLIGTLQEAKSSSKKLTDELIRVFATLLLTRRFMIDRLEMDVLDEEGELLGKIEKDTGINKDFKLYSKKGEYVASIKSVLKIKSSVLTVLDARGNPLIEATSGYGALDFSVMDSRTGEQFTSITRRSLVNETMKESLLNHDVYHMENKKDNSVTFALIGIAVVVDLYYHS